MSNPNVSNEISGNSEEIKLSTEARNRFNTVAQSVISVLDKNTDAQSAIKKLFGEMISNNLRDPENIAKIQDGLYEARDARLQEASPNERLPILTSFSNFMTQFTQ